MAERESISKKLRFEVFKRDSFTCQYCGASSWTRFREEVEQYIAENEPRDDE